MEQITGDQAIRVLDALIADGTIKEGHVSNMVSGIVSKETEKTVTLFHLLFCTLRHELVGPKDSPAFYPKFCTFEHEEHKDSTWERPTHRRWIEFTNAVANTLEVSMEDLRLILDNGRDIMKEIEVQMDGDANTVSLLRLFINTRRGLRVLPLLPTTSEKEESSV